MSYFSLGNRLVVVACLASVAFTTNVSRGAEPIDFAHQIVPILRTHCGECHTGDAKKGGFSLNTRADLLAGGENGAAIVVGQGMKSELIARVASNDEALRMPPEGQRLSAEQIALLTKWIDAGAKWDEGFAFKQAAYEPPLRPRKVELPPPSDGRTNPIDRILDAYQAKVNSPRPRPIDDGAFVRRASLDLVGLLPSPEQLQRAVGASGTNGRAQFVEALLADDTAYAEHWLSFWNDLLRNDYAGTGFITGGRTQISRWLYAALVENMPYDQMARELVAPSSPESAGYANGIKWRGDVSAGQTVEIQFAQSVGQSFLGINLKCASCHDSFIDRWKLDESYGLAAIYSSKPLEIHRCDKPIGRQAKASWLFPELGQIDPAASQPERLQQLGKLLTHLENGRFTRTIVNRLWHRLMGRGIVHPTDAMQTEPWSADLLDWLAADFAEHGYDLKHTLRQIATSEAYRSRAEAVSSNLEDGEYVYRGPRAKRLTAEQFVDAVNQLTGAAPKSFDAPVLRGKTDAEALRTETVGARWIAPSAEAAKFTLRGTFKVRGLPQQATAVVESDATVAVWVNSKLAETVSPSGASPGTGPRTILLMPYLRNATNNVMLVVTSAKGQAAPTRVLFEARLQPADGPPIRVATDDAWQWTTELPNGRGQFAVGKRNDKQEIEPDWQAVRVVADPAGAESVRRELLVALLKGSADADRMVRDSLLKSNFLTRSLGRPNRDQIVSVRPVELTTLEAIDLSNGQQLANALSAGGRKLAIEFASRPDELARYVFEFALSRKPTADEATTARELLGETPTPQAVEDLLWGVLMLPEFMLVR